MLTVAMIAGVLVVLLGVVAFERRQSDVRTLALVAMLMAVAAASRLLVPVPSAKPVLALTILAESRSVRPPARRSAPARS